MNWYNKYRPSDFDQVLGQDLVKSVLQNSLEKNRIKHGYLFSGPKGVGKTTLARIFAAKLNNTNSETQNSIDIIELDAASNTGIDNIRQLIDSSKTPPISGKYKIYIIDEVHMLSKSAMNALLKTLEEPPTYLVFLLATTNPEKLLPTVLSRLTKLNLNAHTQQDLVQNIQRIADIEKLIIDTESLELIARRSGGSQRDSINYLETISSYDFDKISIQQTSQILGLLPLNILEKTLTSLETNTLNIDLISQIENLGFDGDTFLGQFLEYLIDLGFKNNNQFSELIPLVAETISLKLPLTSPTTSLAIIQAKFSPAKPVLEKKTKVEVLENQTVSEVNIEDFNTKTVLEKPEEIAPQTVEKESQTTSENNTKLPTLEELNFIIKNATKEQNSPSILKMLIQKITVFEFTNSIVTLAIDNSIFVSQLKNPKIITFFEDLIQIKTSLKLKVEVVLQENKTSQPEIVTYQASVTKPRISDDITEEKIINEAISSEKKAAAGGIFYEIYKSLPPNVDPNLVPVFTGNLEPPQPQDDWDNQTSSMFEFE